MRCKRGRRSCAIRSRIGGSGRCWATVFAAASHLSLATPAAHGDHGGDEFWLFSTAVGVDDFADGFASIALITSLSSLAATEHAASRYALLTSRCALPGCVLAGGAGFLIEHLGFERVFVATSPIGAPVALLSWFVWRLQERLGRAGPAGP